MRETLFRGKRIDNGEWVEGLLFYHYDSFYEKYRLHIQKVKLKVSFEIDPSTIGQYTGLTANGKKIFEGDIIKIVPDCDCSDDYSISNVYSYNGIFCVDYHGDDFDATALGFLEDYLPDGNFEVIGNIHDNPELLEDKS